MLYHIMEKSKTQFDWEMNFSLYVLQSPLTPVRYWLPSHRIQVLSWTDAQYRFLLHTTQKSWKYFVFTNNNNICLFKSQSQSQRAHLFAGVGTNYTCQQEVSRRGKIMPFICPFFTCNLHQFPFPHGMSKWQPPARQGESDSPNDFIHNDKELKESN